MVAWFVLLAILLFAYCLEVMAIEDRYPLFWSLTTGLSLLVGPITLMYVLAYTQRDQRIHPLHVLHALPYILFTIIICIKIINLSEMTVREGINLIEDGREPIFAVFELFRIFSGPAYLILSLILLKKHMRRIERHFSYTEDIDLKWVRNVILMLTFIWITVIAVNILTNFNQFFSWQTGDNLIYIGVFVLSLRRLEAYVYLATFSSSSRYHPSPYLRVSASLRNLYTGTFSSLPRSHAGEHICQRS